MAGLQGIADCFGISGDNNKVGACGCIRFFAVLLPIAQGAERNAKNRACKIFLAEAKRKANDFDLRRSRHALFVIGGKRLRVGIVHGGGMALFFSDMESKRLQSCLGRVFFVVRAFFIRLGSSGRNDADHVPSHGVGYK